MAETNVKITAAGSKIRRGPNNAFTNTTKTPLNIVAMFNAVGIQDASSNPNPFAPRRSARPTPTSRAFKVASPAPRNTPTIPRYGFVCGGTALCVGAALVSDAVNRTAPLARRAVRPNRRDYGQTG